MRYRAFVGTGEAEGGNECKRDYSNGVGWVTRGRWRRNATWRGAVFPRRSDVAGVAGVYGSGGCGPVVSWVKRMGNWAWRTPGKGLEKAGRIAGLKGAFHTDGWVQLGKVSLATS